MEIRYLDPLQRAWDRMTAMLFAPFDLGRWLVLAFALWLARLASGGGGGGGFNYGGGGNHSSAEDLARGASRFWEQLVEHAVWLPLILLAVGLLLALLLLALWISSRGKLIFLDNVVRGRAAIVEPWGRLGRLGNSLFLWRLGFGVAAFLVIALVALAVLWPAVAAAHSDLVDALSFAAIAILVLFILLFAVVVSLVSLFLDSFIVPIMYRFDLTATQAWRHFLPWLSAHPLHFGLYALFMLVLLLVFAACWLLACFVACLTCCVAMLLLVPLLGSYILSVVLLPLWVTYRAFSVEFLAQFDPSFDLFTHARSAALESEGA